MDRTAFFNMVRSSPFNSVLPQSAKDGIDALLIAWERYGDGDADKLAYILGTAFHESDRFKTMEEYASGAAYEGRTDLGNYIPGDGKRFKGRGFVQVTGRKNYADWSQRLGIDLIANPERAAIREIAARICVEGMMLGTFTGKKLADYVNADNVDFKNARRTVNGTDKADMIASYAREFGKALQAAAEPASAPEPQPAPLDIEERFRAIEARLKALEAARA
jgi:putative chitinase